jgi:two-component system alkaline phosphatase synthesis response regulator PhoP
MTSTAQQILIVDGDHELVQRLREALEHGGYRVLVAQDGEAALHILRREQPDLVLVDLKLPVYDGRDVTRAVRGDLRLVAMPIIRLNVSKDGEKIAGRGKGAVDSLTEGLNSREIVAWVRSALQRARGEPTPRKVIRAGNLVIDLDRRQVQVGNQSVHLTPTELGLLQALAERPDHTLSRLEMMESGLGYSYEGMDRTVDSHIKNLRRKLARAGATAGMIETVFGVGYRLATERRLDAGANQ